MLSARGHPNEQYPGKRGGKASEPCSRYSFLQGYLRKLSVGRENDDFRVVTVLRHWTSYEDGFGRQPIQISCPAPDPLNRSPNPSAQPMRHRRAITMTPPGCCRGPCGHRPRRSAAATEKARMTVLRRERAIAVSAFAMAVSARFSPAS
jgi:hypothetical protein